MTREELAQMCRLTTRLSTLGARMYHDRTFGSVRFDLQRHARPSDFAPGGQAVGPLSPGLVEEWSRKLKDAAKMAVLFPAGLIGFNTLQGLPDMDIEVLGIGAHRYFLFHSALTLWAFKWLYDRYRQTSLAGGEPWRRVVRKATGVALASGAVGVGVHLILDAFQPKSVIFPFFGSLVDGTTIDDRVWLLANGVWAFRIARDLMAVALGPDYPRVVSWVRRNLVQPLFEAPRRGTA